MVIGISDDWPEYVYQPPINYVAPGGGSCNCGLPLVRNPHPDAGNPTMEGLDIGYVWVCIPCTMKALNGWSKRAMRAEGAIKAWSHELVQHRIPWQLRPAEQALYEIIKEF